MWPAILAIGAGVIALVTQYERKSKTPDSKTKTKSYEEGLKDGETKAQAEAKAKRAEDTRVKKLVAKQVAWERVSRRRPLRNDDDLDDDDDTPTPPPKPEGATP